MKVKKTSGPIETDLSKHETRYDGVLYFAAASTTVNVDPPLSKDVCGISEDAKSALSTKACVNVYENHAQPLL